MVRRVLSFLFALALFIGGTLAAGFLLFFAERVPIRLLFGAGFFAVIGASWLWIDFIAPIWRKDANDAERT